MGLAEGRGLCLALARWCLKKKPPCEGTLSPFPSPPSLRSSGGWWVVGGDRAWGLGLRFPFYVHQTPQSAADAIFTSLTRTPTHHLPPDLHSILLQGQPSSSRPARQPTRHLWAPLCLSPQGQRGCAQQMPECGLVHGWGPQFPSLHPRALSSQAAGGRPGGWRALPWGREGEGFP